MRVDCRSGRAAAMWGPRSGYDLFADFRFQIRDESPSSLRTSSRPQPRCPPQRPRCWPRSNLHGGVSSASETGAWTSTIGARAPSLTYPSPSIPSQPAAVCRTPCRSAAGTPPSGVRDVTPRSLRRPSPLQRLVRRRFSQTSSFHGSDKRSSSAAIRPLGHSPVLSPIMAAYSVPSSSTTSKPLSPKNTMAAFRAVRLFPSRNG